MRSNNKHIIFVGNPVPEGIVESSKVHNVNIADNIAQNAVIKGLHKHYKKNLTVISVSSEKNPAELDLGYGVKALTISSNNLHRIIYYISITKNYTKKINDVLKSNQIEDTVIVTNGPYIYMALPAMIARWRYRIKWVPFLIGSVEIPEARFPYNFVSRLSRWTAKRVDGAITYVANSATDYMPGRPFVEIFYLIDEKLMKIYHEYKPKKPKKFTITYTGALTDIYNIDMIIEVIKQTGNKYHWVFAGVGRHAGNIQKLSLSKKYDVDYVGAVSNVEAVRLQKTSHLLLCLRGGSHTKVNRYYSKYAASGKLIEYLCSGTPILAGDIPGFSDKIKPFMTCEKDQSTGQIIKDLQLIQAGYNSKIKLAHEGQQYAFKYFTADYQNKNIYDFLENL
jgi:glycosyltransferase involved in cell wall biosynthesis